MTDPDKEPELATNEEWRAIMTRARKARGLTQEALGSKVGTSQVLISRLESGNLGASSFVLAICRELEIPEPQHFADDDQREWSQLGHVLRRHPDRYQAAMGILRALADAEGPAATQSDESSTPAPDDPRRRR